MSSSGSGFAWDCDPWTVVTVRIISHREGQAGCWVGSMVRMYVRLASICVVRTIRFYACLDSKCSQYLGVQICLI